MQISKWAIDFKANQKSLIAPIWVSFSGLSLHFYNMKYLNKIALFLGCPSQFAAATFDLRRPSLARVLIQPGAAKTPMRRI